MHQSEDWCISLRAAKRRPSSPEGRETLLSEKAVEAFSDSLRVRGFFGIPGRCRLFGRRAAAYIPARRLCMSSYLILPFA